MCREHNKDGSRSMEWLKHASANRTSVLIKHEALRGRARSYQQEVPRAEKILDVHNQGGERRCVQWMEPE